MSEQYTVALSEACAPYGDGRFHVCDLTLAPGDGARLQGRVLDRDTLDGVLAALQQRLPDAPWEAGDVSVLRRPQPRRLTVATNLTGLQREPSWLGEQQSQPRAGASVEVLDENERWVFVRLDDGYLGWMYRAYLSETAAPTPTHQVAAPFTLLYGGPNYLAPVVTRLFAGTPVAVAAQENGWARLESAAGQGYADPMDLRPLADDRPLDIRRRHMAHHDALQFVGVPYLWGGTSVHGIDCSGFAQLLHHLAGVVIPRDADQQYLAGQPVEPPFMPGDLLYFGAKGDHRDVSHVGVSMGPEVEASGWGMIHSSRGRNGVYIDDVQGVASLRDRFLGARRFLL